MKERQSGLLKGSSTGDSIRNLETRLAISVLTVSIAVSAGNMAGRMQLFSESLLEAVGYDGVWLTLAAGAVVSGAALLRRPIGRLVQAAAIFAVSCMSAFQSAPGNLTSLVFFGLSLLLASQYGLLSRRSPAKLVLLAAGYGVCLAIGTYRDPPSASLGAVLNLVGAGFIAYLFIVIASMRMREMENREAELARMVAERTEDLQDEADRRKVAEGEARAAAERNQALAGDREVLLRELHHRSKNDLQMILSLMSLRADKDDHPELADLFRPTRDRIRAIALVHEQLDGSDRFDAIGLRDYLEHLLTYLQASHREYSVAIKAEIDADVSVKLESATHLGLLIHELVLCSYRFSFKPGEPGSISLTAGVSDGDLCVSISDTGAGFPAELNPAEPDQDEIAIVAGLVRRLSCELILDRESGSGWTVTIPLSGVQKTAVTSGTGA